MEIKIIFVFLITLVLILIIDFLWLGVFAKNLYKNELGELSKQKFNLYSALVVYLVLALGIVFFVLNNNLSGSYYSVFLIGALFGLIVYSVYDFTNHAVIKDWSLRLTIIDIIWGSFLCSVVSLVSRYFSDLIL